MKKFSRLLTSVMALAVTFSVTACGPSGDTGEKVDPNRTQLYVGNFSGGVGTKWLDGVKQRFEEQYKDVPFEEGKTGAQIMISNDKNYGNTTLQTTIAQSDYEVFFTEGTSYYDYVTAGLLYDMTDLVTKKVNQDDNKTIYSKLHDIDKTTLNVNEKYYAIPHYEWYNGLSYDAGVFKEKKLYFSDSIDTADTTYVGTRAFVKDASMKKSCGPDGKYNTYDDGLPSSIQEFYKLTAQMKKNNVTPFIWTGKSVHYTNKLMAAIYQNLVGGDEVLLNYTFDSGDSEIEIVKGFNGSTPITEKVKITPENGNQVKQSAGLYYAVEFMSKIFNDSSMYYTPCVSSTYSHLNAMSDFMNSGLDTSSKKIGMLMDGNYWYNEASDDGIFERVENAHVLTYGQKDVRFMPLPVQYAGTVTENNGRAPTIVNGCNSYALINGNISKKHPNHIKIAEEFISFVYSDAELKHFTEASRGILKGVAYDSESVTSQLGKFPNSVIEMVNASKASGQYVKTISNNPIFMKNQNIFSIDSGSSYWSSSIGSNSYLYLYNACKEKETAVDYFKGMAISDSLWNSKYNV